MSTSPENVVTNSFENSHCQILSIEYFNPLLSSNCAEETVSVVVKLKINLSHCIHVFEGNISNPKSSIPLF
jgi:hypothetical protein